MKTIKKTFKTIFTVASVCVLSACGGGGEAGNSTQNLSFDINLAIPQGQDELIWAFSSCVTYDEPKNQQTIEDLAVVVNKRGGLALKKQYDGEVLHRLSPESIKQKRLSVEREDDTLKTAKVIEIYAANDAQLYQVISPDAGRSGYMKVSLDDIDTRYECNQSTQSVGMDLSQGKASELLKPDWIQRHLLNGGIENYAADGYKYINKRVSDQKREQWKVNAKTGSIQRRIVENGNTSDYTDFDVTQWSQVSLWTFPRQEDLCNAQSCDAVFLGWTQSQKIYFGLLLFDEGLTTDSPEGSLRYYEL